MNIGRFSWFWGGSVRDSWRRRACGLDGLDGLGTMGSMGTMGMRWRESGGFGGEFGFDLEAVVDAVLFFAVPVAGEDGVFGARSGWVVAFGMVQDVLGDRGAQVCAGLSRFAAGVHRFRFVRFHVGPSVRFLGAMSSFAKASEDWPTLETWNEARAFGLG